MYTVSQPMPLVVKGCLATPKARRRALGRNPGRVETAHAEWRKDADQNRRANPIANGTKDLWRAVFSFAMNPKMNKANKAVPINSAKQAEVGYRVGGYILAPVFPLKFA